MSVCPPPLITTTPPQLHALNNASCHWDVEVTASTAANICAPPAPPSYLALLPLDEPLPSPQPLDTPPPKQHVQPHPLHSSSQVHPLIRHPDTRSLLRRGERGGELLALIRSGLWITALL